MRPVVPWLLSWYAQDIKYGLFDRGCWPVDRFSRWFVDSVFTMDSACELWQRGSWDFELRTILLPSGDGHDVVGIFGDCAELPVALGQVPPINKRLNPCELHLLQSLNIYTFDPAMPLHQRALFREVMLSSLEVHGIPPHLGVCEARLEPAVHKHG